MNTLLPSALWPLLAETAVSPAGGLDTSTVLLGLLVVAVVWLASTMIGLRDEVETLRETLTVRPRLTPPPAPSAAPEPSPAEVAAIAAAVHCLLGADARLVAVVPPDGSGQAWSREGRREVFQSHQIR